ncbi:hypothetical protein FOXG_08625 [Fusarium oxysporum f. sp. lycopersici 4287]|nr:hypothetical protein FOXG_08625 [Fusarium oxysporum f. sp. lycopersici 4287]KNB07480.1 hypothetical protein FOXG_08625 [Fusarium oxysporum f. sp. lycopersici 4287]
MNGISKSRRGKEESDTDNLHMQTLRNVPQRLHSPQGSLLCFHRITRQTKFGRGLMASYLTSPNASGI